MSDVKRFQFKETIAAPAAEVWKTMFEQDTYRQWTKAFCEGSRYEGTWEEGSRMHFLDPKGDGMVAEIAENRPGEFLSIRHLGWIVKGVEDTESESVRAWAPAYENYTFRPVDGGTEVVVEQDLTDEYVDSMTACWAKALGAVKEICEGG